MKEFELCTDDTSTELANGFIFLIFNIIIFFPFAMLFKIDISWFFTIFGVELILISILKLLKMKKISKSR